MKDDTKTLDPRRVAACRRTLINSGIAGATRFSTDELWAAAGSMRPRKMSPPHALETWHLGEPVRPGAGARGGGDTVGWVSDVSSGG